MKDLKKGIYTHYKGAEYELLEIALNESDREKIVVYRALRDGQIWLRPLSEFSEEIERKGKKIRRFEYLKEVEAEDYEARYKRALADYQNLLKNSAKDKQEFTKYALNDFLQEILPVYDHLKMSLQSLPENEQASAWVKGVEYVLKQFKAVLDDKGVKEIETVGKKFDHNLMDAIEGEGENVVAEIMTGYTLNGRVMRAAKVKLSKEKKIN